LHRRSLAAARSGEGPPGIDCGKSDASVKWLRKQQLRTPFRAHVSGQSYDTRYASPPHRPAAAAPRG
jgi:hypothetical protein